MTLIDDFSSPVVLLGILKTASDQRKRRESRELVTLATTNNIAAFAYTREGAGEV